MINILGVVIYKKKRRAKAALESQATEEPENNDNEELHNEETEEPQNEETDGEKSTVCRQK